MTMETVQMISLNGVAYKLETPGHEKLRGYLDAAARALANDPDRAEILKDLEQAIGEKCAKTLGQHKDVVTVAEIDRVLEDMGPVQAAEPASATVSSSGDGSRAAPRKLYQIREGALVTGVCTGIAAYLNIDVTVVRVAFVVLTFLTGGFWILLYLVMMILVPHADTFEQRAQARGVPFNAQQLIDRAKAKYAEFRAKRTA
jgi:phage shock protein PspC (stress-responsive transcriptional regulator)